MWTTPSPIGVSPNGVSPIEVSPSGCSPNGVSPIGGSPIGVSPNGGGPGASVRIRSSFPLRKKKYQQHLHFRLVQD